MAATKNKSLQQFDTDDPNRIQDIGWTFKEVWRRTRGTVVVSINLITFFILWELVVIYGDINPLFDNNLVPIIPGWTALTIVLLDISLFDKA